MNVIVVVDITSGLTAGDTAIINRLQTTLGHTVTLVSDHAAAPSFSGVSLVVVSPSSNNNQINTKYDNAPCGVFSMAVEPHSAFAIPTFADNGGIQHDFDVSAPGDILLSGTTGDPVDVLVSDPPGDYTHFDENDIGPGSVVVLSRNGTRCCLVRVPQGGVMSGGVVAPTRRIFFTASDSWPPLFNANGWAIFDNSVAYASVAPGQFPAAQAGSDQIVDVNTVVQLTGGGTDSDGTIQAYAWRVISNNGPAITLSNVAIANPTFTAPSTACTIILGLRVTDDDDLHSPEDTVRIDVISHLMARVAVGGVWVEKPLYVAKSGSWY